MDCSYCGQPATMKIVANPEAVCLEHALEFWTGLLAYVRDHGDPCVKDEGLCECRTCEEFRASCLRAAAVKAAGPAPSDRARVPIRLAS